MPFSALSQPPYSILWQGSLVSIQVWMNSKEEQRKTTRMGQICLSDSTASEGFKQMASGKTSFLCKYFTIINGKKSATMHQTTKWLANHLQCNILRQFCIVIILNKVKTSCISSWKPMQLCMKTLFQCITMARFFIFSYGSPTIIL